MFTYEERIRALQMYAQNKSVKKTIRMLGYPGRQTLYKWIEEQETPPREKSTFRGTNTPDHPRHPSVELKLEVLHRCFELGEDVKSVSVEIGYSRASIYTWRRKYLQKGAVALLNPADDPRGTLAPGIPSSSEEVGKLKAQITELQMQVDILKETLIVLKKDPGADLTTLRNREKAAIVGALKNRYPHNSACDGFFGRMKNEMFYGLSGLDVSIDAFIQIINDYIVWYRERRIKESLGGHSPLEYRQNLGLA